MTVTASKLLTAAQLPADLRAALGQPIAAYQHQILENNRRLGWEPGPTRTVGDECSLIVSEIMEAFEAWRADGFADTTLGEGVDGAPPKPEGYGSELADAMIRILHYAGIHGIDIEAEMLRKMRFNETRPWRHGGKAL